MTLSLQMGFASMIWILRLLAIRMGMYRRVRSVSLPTVTYEMFAKEVATKKGIALKEGIIATGDQFVANAERKSWIAKIFDAHALEMEGASVAVVCNALDVPFFILRAISDSADMDAGFDFDTFLESSAKVSADFILDMVEKIER